MFVYLVKLITYITYQICLLIIFKLGMIQAVLSLHFVSKSSNLIKLVSYPGNYYETEALQVFG